MIISASRRTDIPAFYADWFFTRLKAGFVLTRNPMNPKQVTRIDLGPQAVDGFVFWTKNPGPMLSRLDELKDYAYYFQFTLTAYGKDIEPRLPDKKALIDTFKRLSDRVGPQRVIWRYDPVLLSPAYTVEGHLNAYAKMARALQGAAEKCVISFIDTDYRNVRKNAAALELLAIPLETQLKLARGFHDTALENGFILSACSESEALKAAGVMPAVCVDAAMFDQKRARDKGQRPQCQCAKSVDIGQYNTCPHLCKYCYANYQAAALKQPDENAQGLWL